MILTDRIDQGAAGVVAGQVNIGNIVIPEWTRMVLGARAVSNSTTLIAGGGWSWSWQLFCSEMKGISPIDFLGQTTGVALGAASGIQGVRHEYQPLNIRSVEGGETLVYYHNLEDAHAGNGQTYCTFWFGDEGDLMPESYDPLPGVERYGVTSDTTAQGAAGARSAAANFNVTGGKAITRVDAAFQCGVVAAGDPHDGIVQLESTAFATSPIRFGMPGTAAPLLGTGDMIGQVWNAREPLYLPVDRYCVIDAYFDNNPAGVATDYFQVGVEFIRPGE